MNEFINRILTKSKSKNLKEVLVDDPFFRPKDIQKRKKEEKKKRSEIVPKIKSGLQNIKISYKNEDRDSEEERLFLQIFSKLHLNKIYQEKYNGYLLRDENGINTCLFDLRNDVFWISNYDIWGVFEAKFHWRYDEIKHFMKNMLNEHFKLYEFTTCIPFGKRYLPLNEHFKLYEFTPFYWQRSLT